MARLSNSKLRRQGLRGCRMSPTDAPDVLRAARESGHRKAANLARRVLGV